MTVKGLCRFLGGLLVLAGLAGFFAPRLFGMHLTPVHNLVHLASGIAAFTIGSNGTTAAARRFACMFGLAYMGLGLLGFVAPGPVAALLGHAPLGSTELAPDNAVHLILGGAFMLASAARARAARGGQPSRPFVRRT